MISDNMISFINGFGLGYYQEKYRCAAKEVRQGGNYFIGAIYSFNQINQVASLIQQLNIKIAPSYLTTPITLMCNFCPLLIGLPISLLCAATKQGKYETVAQAYNAYRNFSFPFSHIPLPEKLGNKTIAAMNFIADHGDKFLQVAMITGAVAFIALGNPITGGTILATLGYQAIDDMGLVPRKISLFMETYMHLIATVGLIIGGTVIVQVLNIFNLATYIISPLTNSIHYKIDKIAIKLLKIDRVSLEEMESKAVYKESMTYEEIYKILYLPCNYEINPAHCTKACLDISEFPTDNRFERFLELFNKVDWESKYNLIYQKVSDDERFLRFLWDSFPNANQQILKEQADVYITQLAEAKGVTKNEYLATWMREQMTCLIANLTGKQRVKGSQRDLDTAITNCSLILAYLNKLDLNERNDQFELEDTLLKLTVEGGDYCARGIKRTSDEIVRGIIQNSIRLKGEEVDPCKDYELQVLQALQNKRSQIIENHYRLIVDTFSIPVEIHQDVHGFDTYREYLSLGFYPLTPHERSNVGWLSIAIWEMYAHHYNMMISTYEGGLGEALTEVGTLKFVDYMRQFIEQNALLKPNQKKELVKRLANPDSFEKFYNVLFVRLGILREKQ